MHEAPKVYLEWTCVHCVYSPVVRLVFTYELDPVYTANVILFPGT